MPIYHVIYGGRQHIHASSEEEAYRQFWQWVIDQAHAGNFGLIVNEDHLSATMAEATGVAITREHRGFDLVPHTGGIGFYPVCDGCKARLE